MLIDKYLPVFDYKEFHSIEMRDFSGQIYDKVLHCDLSKARVIKFLFRLRGMQQNISRIDHLTNLGFVKLEEQSGREIVYGYITSSPTFNCCQDIKSPTEFISRAEASIIKAVINFQIVSEGDSSYAVSTETRIWCGSKRMKSKLGCIGFL
jgi:hypothetical protein